MRVTRLPTFDSAKSWLEASPLRDRREFLLFTALELNYGLFRSQHKWAKEFFSCLTQSEDSRMQDVSEGVVCHIRCDDAWPTGGRTPHPHYPVAPVRFYEEVAERTGKRLFFLGQWNLDGEYFERLSRIPGARFIPMRSELEDLRLLVHADEVALSCSTFSWSAAFLRLDYRAVHMPRIGIFDQETCPANDAELPGSHMYEYGMGIWCGDSNDRDYILR